MSWYSRHPVAAWSVTACLLVALLFGAQALAAASAPAVPQTPAARLLGTASFAYLGGLRTFVAAVLWNRLEPQFHQYNEGTPIDQRLEFLPTIRLVQLLNPQFEQAYYVASFVLARQKRMDEGLALAKEGIEQNPKSALLRANYIQLLLMQDPEKNLPQMLEQARIGLGEDMTYASKDDEFEALGIFRTVYSIAGDRQKARELQQRQDALGSSGAGLGIERD